MAAAEASLGSVRERGFDCMALRLRQELEAGLVAQLVPVFGAKAHPYVLQCLQQLGYPDSVMHRYAPVTMPPIITAAASNWRKLCDEIQSARLKAMTDEERAAEKDMLDEIATPGVADPPEADDDACSVDWSSGSVKEAEVGKHAAVGRVLCVYGGGHRAVSADDSGEMILWDVSASRAAAGGAAAAAAGGGGGGGAAAAGSSCKMKRFKAHSAQIYGLCVSPDESLIATGCFDGSVKLWTADGDVVLTLREPTTSKTHVMSVCFSTGGKRVLAAGYLEEALLEFDVEGVRAMRVIPAGGYLRAVDSSADGQWVVTTDSTGHVKIWDGTSLTEIRTLDGSGSKSCWGARFSPDSSHMAVVSEEGHLRVWQTSDWSKTIDIEAHSDGTFQVCWSSDSEQIVTSSRDCTVKVWEASSGRLLRTMTGHTSFAWGVAMSDDGKMIMSAGYDETVRVWRHEE